MNKQKGITLIALIVTIIILLILAAITINLVLDDNGLMAKVKVAGDNYTNAMNNEIEQLNNVENQIDDILDNKESVTLKELKAGDYVEYDSGVNGIIMCRVLYPVTSPYGLQIITNENVKNVTLGGATWEEAKVSYNNTITTLNNEAMKYLNPTYANNARCVGSNPSNKNAEASNTVSIAEDWSLPNGWSSRNTGCKATDMNYETDWKAMIAATSQGTGIYDTGEIYWLADRYTNSGDTYCGFAVHGVVIGGGLNGNRLCIVYSGGQTASSVITNGFRPCITLKSEIRVLEGNGTIGSPYKLGI